MDIKQFWDNIASKKIALCGIGISNTPLIMNFLEKGARVYACDRRTREQIGELADQIEAAGAELRLGEHYLDDLEVDIIFRTPGMSFYMPELSDARKKGIAVTSEMEVFFDLCPATIFAVTGSDGKTTTTTLIAEMLKAQGKTVHVGGNIGKPLLPEIEKVFDALKLPPLLNEYSIRKLCENCNFSCFKAKTELGYSPMTLEQSLRETVKWMEERKESEKERAEKEETYGKFREDLDKLEKKFEKEQEKLRKEQEKMEEKFAKKKGKVQEKARREIRKINKD